MDVFRIIGTYLVDLCADLLWRAPNPDHSTDTGDSFEANRHRFRAGPFAVEDLTEKIWRDFSLQGNLLLGDPLVRCAHGQLFG